MSGGMRDARKPWELLVVGVREGADSTACPPLPPHSVAFAAPPVAHSVKPAIAPLLAEWLPSKLRCASCVAARRHSSAAVGASLCACDDVDCLELFARRLRAGWTSVGDQCLLFQAAALYDTRSGSSGAASQTKLRIT